ncbi:MAG: hypothetical protein ACOYOH_05195 [Paracraurococcus sp.]
MKLCYVGHSSNRGWHTMASAPNELRWNENVVSKDRVLVQTPADGGLKLWFVGTANMNRSSNYQIVLDLSDLELIELFQNRFGLKASPLSLHGDRAKAETERRLVAQEDEGEYFPAIEFQEMPDDD